MQFNAKLIISVFAIFIMVQPVFAKKIEVVPFTNETKNTDKNWIGVAFADTLTTKLCKVIDINLLPSGIDESVAVKDGKISGVDEIVFGSYKVTGETLTVIARFVDVGTGQVIATPQATGNVADIFKLQDIIAFSLTDNLKIVLTEEEKVKIKNIPTENLTAYEWFNKGKEEYLDIDKRQKYYQNALGLDPNYVEAFVELVNSYYNYDKAIELCDRAISINPKFAPAYNKKGLAYYNQGYYDKAMEMYEKAISINSTDADPYYNMGFVYAGKENLEKAIDSYKKAAKLGNKKALNFFKASAQFNEAIKINPKDAVAFYNMGSEYWNINSTKKAIEMIEKAININPKYIKAYSQLIRLHGLKKGDINKANEAFEKMISITVNPQDTGEAYYEMSEAYNEHGNNNKAVELYNKAVSIDPPEVCEH